MDLQTHPYSRFSDRRKKLQKDMLVRVPQKILVDEGGYTQKMVSMLAGGHCPVTLYTAFDWAQIQSEHVDDSYALVSTIAEETRALVLPPRAKPKGWRMAEFALVVTAFGQFLIISEKVARGEKLTDSEMRQLEIHSSEIANIVNAVRDQAQRDRQENNKE